MNDAFNNGLDHLRCARPAIGIKADGDELRMRKSKRINMISLMTQKLNEEVSSMCNLSEGVMRKGVAKGMTKGILSSIQSLMKNMDLSEEQAMAMLDIPEEERQNYRDLLKKQ